MSFVLTTKTKSIIRMKNIGSILVENIAFLKKIYFYICRQNPNIGLEDNKCVMVGVGFKKKMVSVQSLALAETKVYI